MSDPLAIAAVTASLQYLLATEINAMGDASLGSFGVLAAPPDRVPSLRDTSASTLNLFLYHTTPHPGWRNMEIPRQIGPGESGQPPLALNLYYLLTAYGADDSDIAAHRLLGHAMRVLHDQAILSPALLHTAAAESDLYKQVERIRISPVSMSIEEITKIWTTFQTQYRISAAFQASVVLLESQRPTRTPLPVLTRGVGDSGPSVQASVAPPFPTITAVTPPNSQTSAQVGDVVTMTGFHLDGSAVTVRLGHLSLGESIDLAPLPGGSAGQVTVQLPTGPPYDPAGAPAVPPAWPANWGPGLYQVTMLVTKDGFTRTTNTATVTVAPMLSNISPSPATRDVSGNVLYTVTCRPQVQPDQGVVLLVGERGVAAAVHATAVSTLTFLVTQAAPGDHWIRLRVDGVDSLLVNYATDPPSFKAGSKVTIA